MIKMGKKVTVTFVSVLIILLALAVGYIVYDKYSEVQERERFSAYQQGLQVGYEQAVVQIAQQAETCQQIPLIVDNKSMDIVAVSCLR